MIRLKDISSEVGLSPSTVSVVLRGEAKKFGIKASTVVKIQEAAKRLGYIKNDFARIMRSGESKIIGYITHNNYETEYSGRILRGILHETSRIGYSLRLYKESESDLDSAIAAILSQKICGLILSGDLDKEYMCKILNSLRTHSIPAVTVNIANPLGGLGIMSNDEKGVQEITEYLIKRGCQRIAYYGVLPSADYSILRLKGFRAAVRNMRASHQFQFREFLQPVLPLSTLMKWDPDAIICDSDYHAARLLQDAFILRTNIPQDVSIAGFGGIQISEYAGVSLTTVAQNFELMGINAVKTLISPTSKKITKIISTKLIIRNSTK
ncbi:MAG: LacI family DNA-binding transcriptional regulator [Lentisphaeria bacterium]